MNVTCSSNSECCAILSSKCVFYEGAALPATGIATNDDLQTVIQKLNTAISSGEFTVVWGEITGHVEDQTDLITYLSINYQALLVSGTNIKTIGGVSILGSGDISAGTGTVTSVSVVSTNGFSGSVATATTTPAITLLTTVTDNQVLFPLSGALTGNANLTWNNSTNVFTIAGISRTSNPGYITFQSSGSSDSQNFTVDWLTSSVTNGGTLTQGVNVFLSTAGVELEDKSALIEYIVTLTKSDGSDNQVKKILVGYRKDGTADPVQTGVESEIFSVGNVTPTVTFSIAGGNPNITINDNTSGGWKVKVWAKVFISN